MSQLIQQNESHAVQTHSNSNASESSMMIQMIQRAAADPAVDVDKMERLMQMHERFVDRQASAAFNAAMVQAQKRIRPVVRMSFNTQANSGYAKLEDIDKQISPVYTEEGFSLSFGTADSPLAGHLRVVCDVMHEQGHTKQYHMDLPLDSAGIAGKVNKTGVHAHGSTNSYARRYLTMNIFNVVMVNEDNDGNPEPANDDLRIQVLADILERVGETKSAEELKKVWQASVKVLQAAGDKDGYEKVKSAVTEHSKKVEAVQ